MLNITFRKTHYVNCFLVFHDYYIEKKPILLVFLFTNIFIKGCPHRKQIKPKVQPIVPSSGKKTYSANHKPYAFSVYIIYVHNIGLALGCRDILVRLYGFIYPCVVQEYLCNCVCINSHRRVVGTILCFIRVPPCYTWWNLTKLYKIFTRNLLMHTFNYIFFEIDFVRFLHTHPIYW